MITLEDRIDNCFMPSMHGMRPNPDDQVTIAVAACLASLARGKPLYAPEPSTAACGSAGLHRDGQSGDACQRRRRSENLRGAMRSLPR